jgi:hypothetical protein
MDTTMVVPMGLGRWAKLFGVMIGTIVFMASGSGGGGPPSPTNFMVVPMRWQDSENEKTKKSLF